MNGNTVRASMLIRSPPRAVFDAFTEPHMLRRFWLRDASGALAPGATVTWEFMVLGASETVQVTGFEVGRRLAFRWGGGIEVDLRFDTVADLGTRVSVTCGGFNGGSDLLEQATNTVEGFSIVLCDLKTLLELGQSAHLVRDKAELITRAMGEIRPESRV
jgi:uncharacterized protein YndB with AHSA1/START domain